MLEIRPARPFTSRNSTVLRSAHIRLTTRRSSTRSPPPARSGHSEAASTATVVDTASPLPLAKRPSYQCANSADLMTEPAGHDPTNRSRSTHEPSRVLLLSLADKCVRAITDPGGSALRSRSPGGGPLPGMAIARSIPTLAAERRIAGWNRDSVGLERREIAQTQPRCAPHLTAARGCI
jgi:hypothetical protein